MPALAGEDVWSPGLLFALQSSEADGLIAFKVMGTVDRAVEAPDGDGAFAPVEPIDLSARVVVTSETATITRGFG